MPYPFWRTWWFVALALIAVLATVFATYRLRTRNIATRTRVLEEQVVERTSEIERRRQIAEGLREIMIILNSNRSLEESLHYIVSQAARLTDAEDTIIYRHKREGQPAIVATNPGGFIRYSPDAALVSLIQAWATRPLQKNEPLIIPDLDTYWSLRPGVQPATLGAHRAALGIPLFLGDQIYGGLILFYNRERSFSDEDLELGFTFADQAALAIANDQLREQAKLTAVASERSRLARDLHDAVTQTLFSASLIAEALPAIWANNSHQGRQLLQELRQLTRGALAEMRTLLLELRPAALEESKLSDLIHQLAEAVVGRTGIPVAITVDCPQKLPAGVRVALYRIAQESLNNVVKHARASQVSLSLTGSTNGVTLWVKDNGRGFDPLQVSGDHLGLDIIHERAEAIGAELSINSQIGQGTEVVVSWIEEPENGIIDEMNPGLFKEM